MLAMVPPWRIFRRFYTHKLVLVNIQGMVRASSSLLEGSKDPPVVPNNTYSVLLLDIKLKVDSSRTSRSDSELNEYTDKFPLQPQNTLTPQCLCYQIKIIHTLSRSLQLHI